LEDRDWWRGGVIPCCLTASHAAMLPIGHRGAEISGTGFELTQLLFAIIEIRFVGVVLLTVITFLQQRVEFLPAAAASPWRHNLSPGVAVGGSCGGAVRTRRNVVRHLMTYDPSQNTEKKKGCKYTSFVTPFLIPQLKDNSSLGERHSDLFLHRGKYVSEESHRNPSPI
jgi:hypothetical protein